MSGNYGPYTITCGTPNNSLEIYCTTPGRTTTYLAYNPADNSALLVPSNGTSQYNTTMFIRNSNNSTNWNIYCIVNGTNYYFSYLSGKFVFTTDDSYVWSVAVNNSPPDVRYVTSMIGISSGYLRATSTATNAWLISYSQDAFGEYGNNQIPSISTVGLPPQQLNPLYAPANQQCNYLFSFNS